jgi:hypothetical protein
MDINKKHIIIFGTLILLLIIIVGGVTYYQKASNLLFQKDESIFEIPKDKEYEIWCYDGEKWKDCSFQETFRPHLLVSINVNLEKFNDLIPYDPYYLCYYSDLSDSGRQCFDRSTSVLGGLVLGEEVPGDKEVFSLMKIFVYPNNNFSEEDELIIMDLEGKLLK